MYHKFQLDTPLQFHENVTKICLPKQFREIPNDVAWIAGFGDTWHGGKIYDSKIYSTFTFRNESSKDQLYITRSGDQL